MLFETGAGLGSGLDDQAYAAGGAEVVDRTSDIYRRSEMILKVKEPQPGEIPHLRRGQIVFTYFHLAASRQLTESLLQSQCIAVAYETLADDQGRLPLLTPMSEVAGRMSIQEGAKCLERPQEGRGILLAGVPGVEPAYIAILGGGVVGANAANRRRLWRRSASWMSIWIAFAISTTSCRRTLRCFSATATRSVSKSSGPTS